MADLFNEAQKAEFRKAFNVFDKDGNGSITAKELGEALKNLGRTPTKAELQAMIKKADTGRNGTIEFPEFLELMAISIINAKLRAAFLEIDKNKNGKISVKELQNVVVNHLGEKLTKMQINEMIAQVDEDGDGQINFEEFIALMTQ